MAHKEACTSKFHRLFTICSLIAFSATLVVFTGGCARTKAYKHDKSQIAYGQSKRKRKEILERPSGLIAPKKRLLVLAAWNDTPIKGRFARNVLPMQKQIIQQQAHVNVVTPPNHAFASEDFFLDAQRLNMPLILEKGRKWGISLLLLGRITKISVRTKEDDIGVLRPSTSKAAVSVEYRLVDIGASKEILKTEIAATSETTSMNLLGGDITDMKMVRDELIAMALENVVNRSMPVLRAEMDRIEWRGRIARIMGNRIYVNAGRATGLTIGDILKVTGLGTDIYDPETGVFIGYSEGEIKGTLEVVEYFDTDGAIARVHSGGNFQEADIIKLY